MLAILLQSFAIYSQIPTDPLNAIDGDPGNWATPQFTNNPTFNHVLDPFNTGVLDDQFTQGSKDYTPALKQRWAMGQTKLKNDLANGAVVIITVGNNNYLYFAGDRARVNGDAQIGFWFYLNGTHPVSDSPGATKGYFTPEHAVGDLLIISDFSGGGRYADVTVYRWMGIDSKGKGILEMVTKNATVAINNNTPYDVPSGWNYVENTYPVNAFYEGYINLNEIPGQNNFCFSSFLLECRSSASLDASLDDYAAGAFQVTPVKPITKGAGICAPGGTVELSATGIGTIKWYYDEGLTQLASTGMSFSPFISETTTFWVTATNSLGCTSAAASVIATVWENPVASATPDTPLCYGPANGGFTITASGGTGTLQYSKDSGLTWQASGVFTGLAEGTYNWTVKDANNCTKNGSVKVTIPLQLTCSIVLVSNDICGEGNGSATVTPVGGTPGFTYAWDNGEYTATAVSLKGGTHSVTVTDANGCTTSCIIEIQTTACPHIFPTQTTCCNYLNPGTVTELQNVCYTAFKGSVTNAIPGVFFYFTSIIAPSADFTIDVIQTKDCSAFKYFAVQQGTQITLFSDGCANMSMTTPSETSTGQARLVVSGAIPGAKYVLAVKYDVKSILGSTYSGKAPTCLYKFVTRINGGASDPASVGNISVVPGCSDNTPLPLPCSKGVSVYDGQVETLSLLNSGQLKVYPNPFSTIINFEIRMNVDSYVRLEIFTSSGISIRMMLNEDLKQGDIRTVVFDASMYPHSAFIYRVMTRDGIMSGTIMKTK